MIYVNCKEGRNKGRKEGSVDMGQKQQQQHLTSVAGFAFTVPTSLDRVSFIIEIINQVDGKG